jgi:hypothetical protein
MTTLRTIRSDRSREASAMTSPPARALTNRSALRLLLAAATVGAGLIHLAFAGEHLQEYLPLGVGFVAAGALQVLLGPLLAVRDSRRLLLVVGAFSALFLGVYLMSRTVGLPLGPEAFEPEPLGRADLLCCALEVPVVVGSFLLARRPSALRRALGRRGAATAVAGLLLTGFATSSALAAPGHEHAPAAHSCPAAPVLTGQLNAQGVDTGVTAYFACRLLHEHTHDHPHE